VTTSLLYIIFKGIGVGEKGEGRGKEGRKKLITDN
jgi:hypothetical protein